MRYRSKRQTPIPITETTHGEYVIRNKPAVLDGKWVPATAVVEVPLRYSAGGLYEDRVFVDLDADRPMVRMNGRILLEDVGPCALVAGF